MAIPHQTEWSQPELSNDRPYNMFQCILQKLFKKSRHPTQCEQTLDGVSVDKISPLLL